MSNVQVNNKIPNENFIKSSSNNNLKQGSNQINGNKIRDNIKSAQATINDGTEG